MTALDTGDLLALAAGLAGGITAMALAMIIVLLLTRRRPR